MKVNLTLVYLSYIPFGTDYLKRFLKSYYKYPAGIEHKLVILFNGHKSINQIDSFLTLLNDFDVKYEYLISPEQYDIASYFFAARNINTNYIAFINTYSEILHENWLNHLYQNLVKDGVGCVSATASWSDFTHNDEYKNIINNHPNTFFKLNNLKKVIFFRFNFYPCVRPHLRTNSFMINRILFLSLKFNLVKPLFFNFFFNYSGSKLKSLCFEHGNDGMTNQIIKLGLRPLVVNKFGIGFEIDQWKDSKTFWYENQQNLLVSDNQTRKYDNASLAEKKRFSYSAWGL